MRFRAIQFFTFCLVLFGGMFLFGGSQVFAVDCCFYYASEMGGSSGPNAECVDDKGDLVELSSPGYCDEKDPTTYNNNLAGVYTQDSGGECLVVPPLDIGEDGKHTFSSRKVTSCDPNSMLATVAADQSSFVFPELGEYLENSASHDLESAVADINKLLGDYWCCVPREVSGVCKSPDAHPGFIHNAVSTGKYTPDGTVTDSESLVILDSMRCEDGVFEPIPKYTDAMASGHPNADSDPNSKYIIYNRSCDNAETSKIVFPPWEFGTDYKQRNTLSNICKAYSRKFCACNGEGTAKPTACGDTVYDASKDCQELVNSKEEYTRCVPFDHTSNVDSCADLVVVPESAPDDTSPTGIAWELPETGVLNQLGDTTVQKLIGRMISMVLGVIGTIALIMVIFAGFLFMTASGNADRQRKATSILTWSALSIMAIFLSYAAVAFIFDAFVKIG